MNYQEIVQAQKTEKEFGTLCVSVIVPAEGFYALVARYGYKTALEIVTVTIVEITGASQGKLIKFRRMPREQQIIREITKAEKSIKEAIDNVK